MSKTDKWVEVFGKHLLGGNSPEELDQYLLELRTDRDEKHEAIRGSTLLQVANKLDLILTNMDFSEEEKKEVVISVVGEEYGSRYKKLKPVE